METQAIQYPQDLRTSGDSLGKSKIYPKNTRCFAQPCLVNQA